MPGVCSARHKRTKQPRQLQSLVHTRSGRSARKSSAWRQHPAGPGSTSTSQAPATAEWPERRLGKQMRAHVCLQRPQSKAGCRRVFHIWKGSGKHECWPRQHAGCRRDAHSRTIYRILSAAAWTTQHS
ncbi:hypothetical protein H4R99_008750 [Coemansia sp. RSA 1722]|nr:hypothetical protein LPJ57_008564 [Coemansia sp. RSA 486]KAJ2227903.1 hypothetical protein IWW45_006832 [Coemansia sp. RSA 485]KAJ2585277.1 hypothetical protein H4R99_008750 [Coemansia sp. RSA 1722]